MIPCIPNSPKGFVSIALCFASLATATVFAVPTNNPVRDFYSEGVYAWTDQLPWENVFVFTDFDAPDNDTRFEIAQDAIEAAGGGILYFPPGTHTFNNHLYLRDGVILRGANPAQPDAKEIDFDPPSRLVFPRYSFVPEGDGTPNDTAFKFIFVAPGHVGRDQGAVNLEINRAGLRLGGGAPIARRVVVFGVRSNNVAEASPEVPIEGQHGWQRYTWRFTRNINVFVDRYALVANNRINDKHWLQHRLQDGRDTFGIDLSGPAWEIDDFEQPGYLIREQNNQWANPPRALAGHQAVFSYTDNYGIALRGGSGGGWGVAPHQAPSLFRRNKVVRDNWVYGTMRVKIHTSGNGLVIKDNVLRDRAGKVHWMHPTGQRLVNPANTLENRGIDWSGLNVLVEGNDVEVYRHRMRDTHYLSVDGEAILFQECCGGTIIDGITIRNNLTNAYIGIYKAPYLRNALIEGNTVTRGATADTGLGIYVEADTNNATFPLYNVTVRNNVLLDGMPLRVSGRLQPEGAAPSVVHDNILHGGGFRVATYVDAFDNFDGDGHPVTPIPVEPQATVPHAPEVDFRITGNPAQIRAGEVVRLQASITNDAAVERVRFFDGTALLAEFTEPPFTALEWTGVASVDDPLYSAVAIPVEHTVVIDGVPSTRTFAQFTSVLPSEMGGAHASAFQDWLGQHFSPAELNNPDLPFLDVNGNGQPVLFDFLAGRDPHAAHPPVQPELIPGTAGEAPRARIRFRPAAPVAAVLEVSADMQTWSPLLRDTDWTLTPDGDDWILEAGLKDPAEGPAFIRLRADWR